LKQALRFKIILAIDQRTTILRHIDGLMDTQTRLRERLKTLYGTRADDAFEQLMQVLEKNRGSARSDGSRWSCRDVVLITYGDQLRAEGETPLGTLSRFLCEQGLDRLINTVHILPFNPSSSDDGFSVTDYRAVDPALGDWDDIRELDKHVDLMFDLVLNHCSRHSDWFQKFIAGEEPYTKYFVEAEADCDLSAVMRPRSLPLLTPVETVRGTRHVWTTFSDDQIDLNYAEPQVLIKMLDVLLFYVQQGARIIRLDAIAYLWKRIGTNCIHLSETHEIVKLLRDVLDEVAPHVILLTETNVPHKENVSYFGTGDEAHAVYQFSLPPLLLDAFVHADATPLRHWLSGFEPTQADTTFLNFTASHDGIGVRPLEGLVDESRFASLIEAIKARGGLVSTRRQPDGSETAYELNISYVDAMSDPAERRPELHARRFLCSQAIMLALPGIPAVYFHSLVGTQNDLEGVADSGQPRRVNRRKFQLDDLLSDLDDAESVQSQIFAGYRRLLACRIEQPAFHPDGRFELFDDVPSSVVAFCREAPDDRQRVHVVANITGKTQRCVPVPPKGRHRFRDLLASEEFASEEIVLQPYQVLWLEES